MNLKEIKEMINLMNENELVELELEKDGLKIRLKRSAGEIQQIAIACGNTAPEAPEIDDALCERAMKLRVRKVIKGYIGFEHLADEERDELTRTIGIGWGWGAPEWLQHALFLCDGERTAWDIWTFLRSEGLTVPLDRFCDALEWTEKQGFVEIASM